MSDLVRNNLVSSVNIANIAGDSNVSTIQTDQSVEAKEGLEVVSSLKADAKTNNIQNPAVKSISNQSLHTVLDKLPKQLQNQGDVLSSFLSSCYTLSDQFNMTDQAQKANSKQPVNLQITRSDDCSQKLESSMQTLNGLMLNAFNKANAGYDETSLGDYLDTINNLVTDQEAMAFVGHEKELNGLFNNQVFFASYIAKAQVANSNSQELKQATNTLADLSLALAAQTDLDSSIAIKEQMDQVINTLKDESKNLQGQDLEKAQSLIKFYQDFANKKIDFCTNLQQIQQNGGIDKCSGISTQITQGTPATPNEPAPLELKHSNNVLKSLLHFGGQIDSQVTAFAHKAVEQSKYIQESFEGLQNRDLNKYEEAISHVSHEQSREALVQQGEQLRQDFVNFTTNQLFQENLPATSNSSQSSQSGSVATQPSLLQYSAQVNPGIKDEASASWVDKSLVANYELGAQSKPVQTDKEPQSLSNFEQTEKQVNVASQEKRERLGVLLNDLNQIREQRDSLSSLGLSESFQNDLEAKVVDKLAQSPLFATDPVLSKELQSLQDKVANAPTLEQKSIAIRECFNYVCDTINLLMNSGADDNQVLQQFFASSSLLNSLDYERFSRIVNSLQVDKFFANPSDPQGSKPVFEQASLGSILSNISKVISTKNKEVGQFLQAKTNELMAEGLSLEQRDAILQKIKLVMDAHGSLGDDFDSVSHSLFSQLAGKEDQVNSTGGQSQKLVEKYIDQGDLTRYQYLQKTITDLNSQKETLQNTQASSLGKTEAQLEQEIASIQEQLDLAQSELGQIESKCFVNFLDQADSDTIQNTLSDLLVKNVQNGCINEIARENGQEASISSLYNFLNAILDHKGAIGTQGNVENTSSLFALKAQYEAITTLSHNKFFTKMLEGDRAAFTSLIDQCKNHPENFIDPGLKPRAIADNKKAIQAFANLAEAFNNYAQDPSAMNAMYLYGQLSAMSSKHLDRALPLIYPHLANHGQGEQANQEIEDLKNSFGLLKDASHLLLLAGANSFITEHNLKGESRNSLLEKQEFKDFLNNLAEKFSSNLSEKQSKALLKNIQEKLGQSLMFLCKVADSAVLKNNNTLTFGLDTIGSAISPDFTANHNIKRLCDAYVNDFNKLQVLDKGASVEESVEGFRAKAFENPELKSLTADQFTANFEATDVLMGQLDGFTQALDLNKTGAGVGATSNIDYDKLSRISGFKTQEFQTAVEEKNPKDLEELLADHKGETLGYAFTILKELFDDNVESLLGHNLKAKGSKQAVLADLMVKPYSQKEASVVIKDMFKDFAQDPQNAAITDQNELKQAFIKQLKENLETNHADVLSKLSVSAENFEQHLSNLLDREGATLTPAEMSACLKTLKTVISKQDDTISYGGDKTNTQGVLSCLDDLITYYDSVQSGTPNTQINLQGTKDTLFNLITQERLDLATFAMVTKNKSKSVIDSVEYGLKKVFNKLDPSVKAGLLERFKTQLSKDQISSFNSIKNIMYGANLSVANQSAHLKKLIESNPEFNQIVSYAFAMAAERISAKIGGKSINDIVLNTSLLTGNLLSDKVKVGEQEVSLDTLFHEEFSKIFKDEQVARSLVDLLRQEPKVVKKFASKSMFLKNYIQIQKSFNNLSKDLKHFKTRKEVRSATTQGSIQKSTSLLTDSFSKLPAGSELYIDHNLSIKLINKEFGSEDSIVNAKASVGVDLSNCLEIVKNQDGSYEVFIHKDGKVSAEVSGKASIGSTHKKEHRVSVEAGVEASAKASVGGSLGSKITFKSDEELSLFLAKACERVLENQDLATASVVASAEAKLEANVMASAQAVIPIPQLASTVATKVVDKEDAEPATKNLEAQAGISLSGDIGVKFETTRDNTSVSYSRNNHGKFHFNASASLAQEAFGVVSKEANKLVQFNNTYTYTKERTTDKVTDISMQSTFEVLSKEDMLQILRNHGFSDAGSIALCNKFQDNMPVRLVFDKQWDRPEFSSDVKEIYNSNNYKVSSISVKFDLLNETSEIYTHEPEDEASEESEDKDPTKGEQIKQNIGKYIDNTTKYVDILSPDYAVTQVYNQIVGNDKKIDSSLETHVKKLLDDKKTDLINTAKSYKESLSKGEIPPELAAKAKNNKVLQKLIDTYIKCFSSDNKNLDPEQKTQFEQLQSSLISEGVKESMQNILDHLSDTHKEVTKFVTNLLKKLPIQVTSTVSRSRVVEIPLTAMDTPQVINNFVLS